MVEFLALFPPNNAHDYLVIPVQTLASEGTLKGAFMAGFRQSLSAKNVQPKQCLCDKMADVKDNGELDHTDVSPK